MPWIGAVASIGGSLLSGAMGSNAASSAAQTQANSASNALNYLAQQNRLQQQNLAPFLTGGTEANGRLLNQLGLIDPAGPGGINYRVPTTDATNPAFLAVADPFYAQYGGFTAANQPGSAFQSLDSASQLAINQAATNAWGAAQPSQTNTPGFGSLTKPITLSDIQADPVYASGLNFGLNQGIRSINNQALASGNYNSGATLKALTQFANDYGTTKAQAGASDIMANRGQQYGFLSGVANQGLSAAGASNNALSSLGSQGSNLITGAGNALAAGQIGSANAYSGLGASIGNAYNSYNNNQLLSTLLGNNAGNAANYGGTGMGGYATGMSDMFGQLAQGG